MRATPLHALFAFATFSSGCGSESASAGAQATHDASDRDAGQLADSGWQKTAHGDAANEAASAGGSGGSAGSNASSAQKPDTLLFWSGFEGATALDPVSDCYGHGCWQGVSGTDTTTGFTWPPQIGGGDTKFQLIIDSPDNVYDPAVASDYMFNEIRSVTGHRGDQTQVMYSQISKSGCCGSAEQGGGSTQDSFMMLPNTDVTDLYESYWVKLQPDLVDKMNSNSSGTWRALWELKSSDTDMRYSLNILTYGGQTPWWMAMMDGWPSDHEEYWRVNVDSSSLPVPIADWFKVEVFFHRSNGDDGRVWMAVNGHVVADQSGWNIGHNGSPVDRIFFNLYSGSPYPIYQSIDDWQVWSTFPKAAAGDAWYDPPYAPH